MKQSKGSSIFMKETTKRKRQEQEVRSDHPGARSFTWVLWMGRSQCKCSNRSWHLHTLCPAA